MFVTTNEMEGRSVADSIAKRKRAVMMAIFAALEQAGILWVFQAVDMAQRPDPTSSDWTSPGHLLLYEITFANLVLAAALYNYIRWRLPDVYDRVWWTALAMAISPWTTFMHIYLSLPIPDPLGWAMFIGGLLAPYVLVAAALRSRGH
jgi:hypothetical protein